MADLQIESLKKTIRNCLSEFINDKSSRRYHPIHEVLKEIHQFRESAFLCGGAVRDILLSGRQFAPRDLDIIFAYLSKNKIESLLKGYKSRRTKFGGISIKVRDWNLDIWPLLETWAFKEQLVRGTCIADFPKTTFLDVDAVAVELFTKRGRTRRIYSKGFFEAILNKTIDINFEENPYPAICIVKSLVIADRYKFALGPKLAKYIEYHAGQIEMEELLEIYKVRYGAMRLFTDKLSFYLKAIKEHLRLSSERPMRLHSAQSRDNFNGRLWTKIEDQISLHPNFGRTTRIAITTPKH
ncbi:MAG: hypothetical protein MUP16_05400 [Sedimentisphaerales bacterium]|nr:hypothetical protein [Sedimentisphaerales bacterium]